MFSTIKGGIIFFVTLVMVVCAVVIIYFTHRDVGNAMLLAQEKSAANILHSLDIIIRDDYYNLLSDKRTMTLLKRQQLKDAAHMIESVFKGYCGGGKDGRSAEKAIQWLDSAPFGEISYFIINKASQIIASSGNTITTEAWKALKDTKHQTLSHVMSFDNLKKQGDYASFILETGEGQKRSVLAHFLPMD